jgi:hypothetical protein
VRTADNDFFPLRMTPLENPFYLDVPFSDVNDPTAFAERCQVVPWARQIDPAGARCKDAGFSYMKNRWVAVTGPNGQTCYGQTEDAGPGRYHDAAYVFGTTDARPANLGNNNDGMDVSPALNGCLGFAGLDNDTNRIDWQFVNDDQVPAGPWLRIVTTSGVSQ